MSETLVARHGAQMGGLQLSALATKVLRRISRWRAASWEYARHRFSRFVYGLPYFRRFDPRRSIQRCIVLCHQLESAPNGLDEARDWYLQFWPAESIERRESIALDEADQIRFRTGIQRYQNGAACTLPEIFLACLHDASVDVPTSLITTKDNTLIFESALSRHDVLESSGMLDRFFSVPATPMVGSYSHLMHPWANAYYHWVVEVLPKLSLLERNRETADLPLLVNAPLYSFQKESLELIQIPPKRIVPLTRGRWQVEKLFFPEMLGPTSSPSPRAISWLRSKFIDGASSSKPWRRVYLSRRDAPNRKVINESEVTTFLKQVGFEVVCPGEMSFRQQIALFHEVEIVVAPHGAGLTNIIFAPQDALVVEFFGENYINGCFWAITNICGQRHAFLSQPTSTPDYSVPVHRLKALLRKLGVI